MKFSRLKTSKGVKYPVICSFIAILAGFSFPQLSQAQQSASQSSISIDPLKTIQWASGPQTINLGMADINLPKGYRLTDAHGARVILDSVNNPVPDGVLAVLAPDSGKWWALLQYSDSGYVKDADITQINPKKVLKEAQARINANQGTASKATLTWQSQPVYDPATHSWTWALDAQTPSVKVLNQMAVLLGRHGVLQITAIQNYPLSATPSLQQLAANITFKDGERYTDFQSGDRIAQIGLADLIAGGKPASTSFMSVMTVWVYFGLGAALIAGGVVVLVRRKNHHHTVPAKAPVPAVAKAPIVVAAKAPALVAASAMASISSSNGLNGNGNGNGNGHSQFNGNGNGNGNGHAQPKAAPVEKRESRQFHRNRRKRMFDYPKFYTNVMNELSLRSYNGPTIATNGKSKTNGHANGANGNGHANGHANGNTNGYANGHTNGTNGSGATEGLKSEIVELIATQKNLIQEQKCLLEQQTRLIEEKRWLIQEQTAFLKNQALVNDQQYPLKFE